ncbi:MAG: DUF3426 domain-containing protein [Deltaproteobacteria bacterium]|nr:DUF3426 domain-containing protein [Deltaproteobacteria bacterium]
MIIECPACHTRYRMESSVSVTDATLFECSREQCGHVFSYLPESSPQTPAAPPLMEDPPVEPTDAFVPDPALSTAEDSPLMPPTSPPSFSQRTPAQPSLAKDNNQAFSTAEDFSLDSPALSSPVTSFPSSATNDAIRRDNPVKRSASLRPRPRPTPVSTFSIWPMLGLLGLLVIGYYFLGNRWRTNVTDTEGMLARLPVVGSSFVASQFSPQHIVLSDVKSGYWVTKDSKRVFAISGKATNNASVAASTIQIEGQLHDIDGETIDRRTISCGMETTAESLSSLTTREINVMQGLAPPKQFHVPPGQSVSFLIVFPSPPPTITELSCRVATAQFSTS